MHDIKAIRENPQAFDAGLARRGVAAAAGNILTLDAQRRMAIQQVELLQAENKRLSLDVAKIKGGQNEIGPLLWGQRQALKEIIISNNGSIADIQHSQKRYQNDLDQILINLPNLPATSVPSGSDEKDNYFIHDHGIKRDFSFLARQHFDFGVSLGIDFESAQTVSGARFVYLRGQVARLNRALGQFMLDVHTQQFNYQEVAPPLLVRKEAMFGTGQLPKFEEDSYRTFDQFDESNSRWLIPTAEVSLTNIVREHILVESELPLRFTALTPCFRSEAGAAGRDTRGLIRQHQFDKVELVSITTPDSSDAEHERMTQAAETILDRLALPYRRMLLCAGDMGFTAKKTYDLEVWLPGQAAYREISSCSNCGDFQARRMNARFRVLGEKGTTFVHTLNGSGVAVGRALVAVLENYQQEDGSVIVPDALLPYMGGLTKLEP